MNKKTRKQYGKVENKSTNLIERAVQGTCPRCQGHGGTMGDARRGQDCYVCKGKGITWIGNGDQTFRSGWYRPIGAKISESVTW